MNHSFFNSCVTAIWIVSMVSCSQGQEIVIDGSAYSPEQTKTTVHFTTRSIETKTVFGNAESHTDGRVTYPCFWTGKDSQIKISLNYEYAVVAGVNTDAIDDEGHIIRSSFDASFDGIDTESPYRFFLVSPSDALLWTSQDRSAVSVSISANQSPSASSVDENAMILIAQSDSYDIMPQNVEVDFNHVTSYGKLSLSGLGGHDSLPSEEDLVSITLISDGKPLAGSWYYYLSDGSVAEKEGTNSIVINTTGIDVIGGEPIWFAVAPVDMAGEYLTVRANFSDASYLERTIKLNDDFCFSSGRIVKFAVNMASASAGSNIVSVSTPATEEVYQLVSSLNSLKSEDQVIFLDSSTSPGYAMTSNGSRDGLEGVAASTSSFNVGADGAIRLPESSTVCPMTVKSISNGSVVFYDGGRDYLGYSSSGQGPNASRYLSLSTTTRTWTLSFSNNASTMYLSIGNGGGGGGGSSTKYYFGFSGGYFSIGTSARSFAIYKKVIQDSFIVTDVDLTNASVLEYNDFGAYLSSGNLLYGSTTDQMSREYSTDGTLTFSILDPAEEQVIELSGIKADASLGDSFQLGVKFISGITTAINDTFLVFVVKEEGHKLWLTDMDDNGFIVKR